MGNPFFNANNTDTVRSSFWMSDEGPLRVDAVTTGLTYIGYSIPGAGEYENLWKIKKITESGTLTTMLYPSNSWGIPDKSYSYNWNERTGYTYLANTGKLSYPPNEISVYDNSSKRSIPETMYVLPGSNLELKVIGGQIGDGITGGTAFWTWYDDSCGGNVIGYGETITVSPTGTTMYYLNYTGGINSSSVCIKRNVRVQ